MNQNDLAQNETLEACRRCGRETIHRITIALERTTDGEDVAPENVKFARKPTRTAVCVECEARSGATPGERERETERRAVDSRSGGPPDRTWCN
ncbi:DUF7835 family putative zinc beta-ribbon protein [Halegenticoccus tardaugens]|uniref:DUF7835 family putative zinc beta-ribbon protein n=1 Tax=Halegenticoccus tardaugens TaxID=2071624 RepID=UPI00100B35AD|nr:hypothetical protein [Halegenticoccus tardaugens]